MSSPLIWKCMSHHCLEQCFHTSCMDSNTPSCFIFTRRLSSSQTGHEGTPTLVPADLQIYLAASVQAAANNMDFIFYELLCCVCVRVCMSTPTQHLRAETVCLIMPSNERDHILHSSWSTRSIKRSVASLIRHTYLVFLLCAWEIKQAVTDLYMGSCMIIILFSSHVHSFLCRRGGTM